MNGMNRGAGLPHGLAEDIREALNLLREIRDNTRPMCVDVASEQEPSGEAGEWADGYNRAALKAVGERGSAMWSAVDGEQELSVDFPPAALREIGKNAIRLADYVDAQSQEDA